VSYSGHRAASASPVDVQVRRHSTDTCGLAAAGAWSDAPATFSAAAHFFAMTRYFALLLAVLLAAPTAVQAASAPAADVGAAFGNTVLTIDPDGRTRKIWLKPDGTWTGLSRRGRDLAGTWSVQGDQVCLKQSKPRLPGGMCSRFPTEPGASLEAKDPTGKTVQLKLVKGRAGE
jgi:hypothetical protein